MDDPITQRLAQMLRENENIFVPVGELYDRLAAQGMGVWMDEGLLVRLLMEDDRFIVLDGLEEALFSDDSLLAQRLRELGLLHGPWVVLSERVVSPSVVMADLLHYLRELNAALESAWQSMTGEEPEVAEDILNLLLMGDMLERQVKEALREALAKDLQVLMESSDLLDGGDEEPPRPLSPARQ